MYNKKLYMDCFRTFASLSKTVKMRSIQILHFGVWPQTFWRYRRVFEAGAYVKPHSCVTLQDKIALKIFVLSKGKQPIVFSREARLFFKKRNKKLLGQTLITDLKFKSKFSFFSLTSDNFSLYFSNIFRFLTRGVIPVHTIFSFKKERTLQ